MQIGVAISTFNRPDFLDVSLWHWNKYRDETVRIIVIDDGSKFPNENEEVCLKYNIEYVYQNNQGISGTKTKGLSILKNCDYIFLADDDIFPVVKNWYNSFIEAYKRTGNHHFIYLIDKIGDTILHGPIKNLFGEIFSSDKCGGMLLFVTNECLKKVGGFDTRMKFYGYEHSQWSLKINSLGFTKDGKYLCPQGIEKDFFSIDFDVGWKKLKPEYWREDLVMQSSITTTEEKKESYLKSIDYNSTIFGKMDFYTEI